MKSVLSRFVHDESGATAIEYGLIGALLSIAIVAGASQLGKAIGGKFSSVASQVSNVMN